MLFDTNSILQLIICPKNLEIYKCEKKIEFDLNQKKMKDQIIKLLIGKNYFTISFPVLCGILPEDKV